jgi:hypothetical protein
MSKLTFGQFQGQVFRLAKKLRKVFKLPSLNVLYVCWEEGKAPQWIIDKYCK